MTGYKVVNKKSGWVLGQSDLKPQGELYPRMEDVRKRIGKRYCRRIWDVREGNWDESDPRWVKE